MSIALKDIREALEDRFRVEREVGSGGWAIVYLAEDLKHGRRVAIKVLRPELATAVGAERFEREVAVVANLRHPHLLPLLDSGSDGGFSYYVMPWLEGESLRHKLAREGPLTIAETVRLGREVADALALAHSRGVVHRDIKPGNILLDSGHAVVTDFGIAAVTREFTIESLTEAGLSPGTPHYMAPEQVDGESEVDGRTDIYGLGCVLYEMLAGEPPVPGTNPQVVLARKLVGEIPRLRVARGTVPPALEEVVHRALARVPADRYQDAAELERALASIPVGASTAPREAPRPDRTPSDRAAIAAGIGVAAIALTTAIGFLTTTAFDLKLQIPESFRPSLSNHLVVGGRALLPVFVLSLVAMGAFLAMRLTAGRIGATLTRVPALEEATRAIDRSLVTRGQRMVSSARPGTLADTYFVGLILVSLLLLGAFGDLLAVLWSTETEILSCEHKPLHRSYMLVMVILIVASGSLWLKLFGWLRRRGTAGGRIALARWGSLAWILGLLVALSLPWRIINDDGERVRIEGRPAYLLHETNARLLIFDPGRGFAEALAPDEAGIERLGIRGHPFEGSRAFESGVPLCGALTTSDEGGS